MMGGTGGEEYRIRVTTHATRNPPNQDGWGDLRVIVCLGQWRSRGVRRGARAGRGGGRRAIVEVKEYDKDEESEIEESDKNEKQVERRIETKIFECDENHKKR